MILIGHIAKSIKADIKHCADQIIRGQSHILYEIKDVKFGNIKFSTYDYIAINNIIAALTRIEEEKCVSYKQEIKLLNKILYNGQ